MKNNLQDKYNYVAILFPPQLNSRRFVLENKRPLRSFPISPIHRSARARPKTCWPLACVYISLMLQHREKKLSPTRSRRTETRNEKTSRISFAPLPYILHYVRVCAHRAQRGWTRLARGTHNSRARAFFFRILPPLHQVQCTRRRAAT